MVRLPLLSLLLLAAACGDPPPPPAPEEPTPDASAGTPTAAGETTTANPTGRQETDGPTPGLWKQSRRDAWADKVERLESLGYLQGYKKRGQKQGVTLHEKDRVWTGLNLYTSGHAPEAVLMDMDGAVLHRWRCEFSTAWPDYPVRTKRRTDTQHFWRRVHLYENGDLLAIFGGFALIKVNAASEILWVYEQRAHHDLEVQADGSIFVLTRKARRLPRFGSNTPVVEDFVAVLTADGEEQRKVSVLECFENSEYEFLLDQRCKGQKDPFHTNTIEVLDGALAGRNPAFSAGRVLVSCRNFDTIAVLDLEEKTVPWASHDQWKSQHQPTVLDNGRLLLFDNLGHPGPHGRSRVVELDLSTSEIAWTYAGTQADPFQSDICGSCIRLPNGNTLITESDAGRAIEVDADGELLWEFVSPHRAGPGGGLIANLLEVTRLDPDFPTDWLGD